LRQRLNEAPSDDAQCVEGELTANLRWEPHGVGLDRAPCGTDDADDSVLRANPDHGSKSNEK